MSCVCLLNTCLLSSCPWRKILEASCGHGCPESQAGRPDEWGVGAPRPDPDLGCLGPCSCHQGWDAQWERRALRRWDRGFPCLGGFFTGGKWKMEGCIEPQGTWPMSWCCWKPQARVSFSGVCRAQKILSCLWVAWILGGLEGHGTEPVFL